jgi:hypothetical protein
MKVGAYSLCYQEGKLLSDNIKLMYDLIDQFVIVIGQVEISKSHMAKVDTTSRSSLELIEDPAKKIVIIERKNFESKDEMTCLALEMIETEIVIQLDCDEFWSVETFKYALEKIEQGFTRILIPHIIYFRGAGNILSKKDVGNLYFSPARMWRVIDNARLGHFTGKWTIGGVETNDLDFIVGRDYPIHHFGWVQSEQILRKIKFYRAARKYKMPSARLLLLLWPLLRFLRLSFSMGPNKVQIVKNELDYPPEEIKNLIKSFRKSSE